MSWVKTGSPTSPCCCGVCHELAGDILNAVIADVDFCASCYTYNFQGTHFDYKITGFTINGMFDVVWFGFGWLFLNFATYSYSQYSSTDGTCSGDPVDYTGNVSLEVTCNVFTGISSVHVYGEPMQNSLFQMLFFSAQGVFDTPLPNDLTDPDFCGQTPLSVPGSIASGLGGTVTLGIP